MDEHISYVMVNMHITSMEDRGISLRSSQAVEFVFAASPLKTRH